jgi:hypothetical protein
VDADADANEPLQRIAAVWRGRVDRPARLAAWAALFAAVLSLAHLARLGTTPARAGAAFLLAALAGGSMIRFVRMRRGWKRAPIVVARTIVPTDPDLGYRTTRALRLVDRAEEDPSVGSAQLARAHLDRLLARAQHDAIALRASLVARSWQRAGLFALGAACIAVLVGPFRVIEGLDVLCARGGRAPVPFEWLERTTMVAHPPEYLHEHDTSSDDLSQATLPYGSLLTIHGDPIHDGRTLVLFDGATEVPFVDDASGGVVARWPLTTSAQLRVGARFGSVLIPEPQTFQVTSIPDDAPEVVLAGAPKTVKLLDEPEIEIRYEASDDHGIREVDLVLRSAAREERRVLARPDGETRQNRGGYRLRATDPFFKRSFAPTQITVEARDNDPITGPKWGKSAIITAIPPLVGEPEAMRYEAFARVRDAFVDLTAFRIDNDLASGARKEKQAHIAREREEAERATSELDRALDGSYGGLYVMRPLRALARGQTRKLGEALDQEARKMTKASHASTRKATEDATLAIDGGLRRLDANDAALVAKRLADVADDAAEGAAQAKQPSARERGVVRLDAATGVLDGGGAQLRRLGRLGHDLGEIVANDLKRIKRAQGAADFFHAELAARDLAARLRRPAPSFEGGHRTGVEAGGGQGGEGDPSDGGEIAREQEQLEELARDHAAELSGVEQAMNNATSSEELRALEDEARQHAAAVREAVRSLPQSGAEPNSAESAAAAAREHAQAMADELDRGAPGQAAESGRNALGALDQADRAPPSPFPWQRRDTREEAKRAADKLEPEVRWAEHALERLRQAAAARAAEELKKTAPRESKLADRAKDLENQGNRGEGALPGHTLELLQGAESSMREAARALGAGEVQRGLSQQRDAQRQLDMARSENQGEEGEEASQGESREGRGGDQEGGKDDFRRHAQIPGAQDHKGPEAFRRRVLEGLGGPADARLRESVKRYAEGLIR